MRAIQMNLNRVIVVVAVAFVLVLPGCGKKKPTRPGEAASLSSQGWELFAQQDYNGALAKFDEALDLLSEHADASHGRAWTLAFLGQFDEARFTIVLARDLDPDNPDVWAGGAFIFSVLDNQDEVIYWAESALMWNAKLPGAGTSWFFSRRSTITHLHLRWVLAEAFLNRGSYSQCAGQLDIIERGVVHSVNPQSLLADLQRLFSTLSPPF